MLLYSTNLLVFVGHKGQKITDKNLKFDLKFGIKSIERNLFLSSNNCNKLIKLKKRIFCKIK